MVIFPEGLSIPPPVNPETDIAATGIVFIQVADYPFVQDQYYRNYTGTLTSTAVGPSIAPTPTPTPGPLPSYAIYVAIGVGALLLLLVVWFLLRQLLAEQLKAQEPEPPKPEELQEQLQRLQEQFLQFQQPQQLQSDELPV
jgi:hypothetical protein